MPRQKTLVRIEPAVLKWIIEESGWKTNELAEKLNTESETIEEWKTKSVGISLPKLEKLSKQVNRPLALFFLKSPPTEPELIDYRKLTNGRSGKLGKPTIKAIRKARYLQSVAYELLTLQETDPNPKIDTEITLYSSPESVADSERRRLGFESEDLAGRRKPVNDFYNALRRKIESLGIFVFQDNMPVDDVRGFSLSFKVPRIIVISSKDTIHARIFSLVHEYGHVLLNEGGMCTPQATYGQGNAAGRIEAWCNYFAASVLMPKKEFLSEYSRLEDKDEDLQRIIQLLSSKFRTSKTATAIRIANIIQNETVSKKIRLDLDKFGKESPKKYSGKTKGGPSPINLCISRRGHKFISLVLESKQNKRITGSDVIDYLGLNLNHIKKLQEKVL